MASKWIVAHLVRPLDADYGEDKVYMHQVMGQYPELGEFIREHVAYGEDNTENLILDAHVLDYPKIAKALLVDMKFEVVSLVDSSSKQLQGKEKAKRIAKIMESVREVAES